MMEFSYEKGTQPCKEFRPEDDFYPGGGNIHDCFCMYSKGLVCGGTVSFCLNCHTDHHSGGKEECICSKNNS